jgi:hypothetical protein
MAETNEDLSRQYCKECGLEYPLGVVHVCPVTGYTEPMLIPQRLTIKKRITEKYDKDGKIIERITEELG